MPRQPVNRDTLRRQISGDVLRAAGFSMLYAALDQGNRLDWLNSGLVCGFLLGGFVLIAAFVLQILVAEHPWINPGFLLHRNIALVMAILVLYRFIILSTSYPDPAIPHHDPELPVPRGGQGAGVDRAAAIPARTSDRHRAALA